jgi:hypothetical protein
MAGVDVGGRQKAVILVKPFMVIDGEETNGRGVFRWVVQVCVRFSLA